MKLSSPVSQVRHPRLQRWNRVRAKLPQVGRPEWKSQALRQDHEVPMVRRKESAGFLILCLAALVSLPAFSQVDATGEWSPRLHEDQAERMEGPDLGDYLGLP